MRVGFVTCVQLGLSCMQAIYDSGGKLELALTLQDQIAPEKSGRVYLDEFCSRHDVPLTKIRNVNDADALGAIRAAELDWLCIVGWSQIAREAVLSSTRNGVLGMHPTLLPIGRGRAPIPWAILLGLPETGVTLFKLDQGVDTGPILAQKVIPLAARETATDLYRRIDAAHIELLQDNWQRFASKKLAARAQDHGSATQWAARRPEDGRLDPGMEVGYADRLIRAVTRPYPGAFLIGQEACLRIWATGAPGEDLGGEESAGPVRRLHFRNGWLDAVDWTTEPQ